MAEAVELTNMCMIYDNNGNVLVQEKINPNWHGMTYPGGHVEPGESIVGSVVREVREETGLEIREPKLCGIKQFQKLDGTRYLVFLYKTDQFSGVIQSSREGEVFWIQLKDADKYQWVPDFSDMRRVFEDESVSELFYYRDETLKREYF